MTITETGGRTVVREVLAAYLEGDPAELGPDFPLRGPRLHGSIARYALDAALRRRLGRSTPVVFSAATLGELETALFGADGAMSTEPGQTVPADEPLSPASEGAVTCGIDLEHAEHLPETDDYWAHPFYQSAFTPRELAYCLMQEQPRLHLAARWGAKEAVRKALPALMNVPFNETEVIRAPDGSPSLVRWRGERSEALPCHLSLSHSGTMATAMVVASPGPQSVATAKAAITAPDLPAKEPPARREEPARSPEPVPSHLPRIAPKGFLGLVRSDLARKAEWYGQKPTPRSLIRMCLSDGSTAQILYRLMQACRRGPLRPFAALIYRGNAVITRATIGRDAEIGPGFVILHSLGVMINRSVRAGSNLVIEHEVTIGADEGESPVLGDNVFIGAGAKVVGGIRVGSNVRIGANSVVIQDVPDGATVAGVPASIVRLDAVAQS